MSAYSSTPAPETGERAMLASPSQREVLLQHLMLAIRSLGKEASAIAAGDTAAIPAASLLASRLNLPMVYLRASAKEHGTRRQMEGRLPEAAAVVLLFGSLPDEETVLAASSTIQAEGGEVVHWRWLEVPTDEALAARIAANEAVVAEALLTIGAVAINRREPYRYVSGILSPIYTDNRLLISHPLEWTIVIDAFMDLLAYSGEAGQVDRVAGVATSGIPHASLIAGRLGLPMVYVRSDGSIAGELHEGERVVLIEDHITTGKSALEAGEILRRNGAACERCLAIFTYNRAQARGRFKREGADLATLSDLHTLLQVGIDRGHFGVGERDAVLDWLRDPSGWTPAATQEPD